MKTIEYALADHQSNNGKVRNQSIDSLKGVAIILIIVYHAGGVLQWPNRLHGEIGVDLFLFSSGWLLAFRRPTEPAGAFLARRFFRVLPAYWIALGFFGFSAALLLGQTFNWQIMLSHVLAVHATMGGAYYSPVNDSFWFITTIIGLYLAFTPIRRFSGSVGVMLGAAGVLTLTGLLPIPGFDHLAPRLMIFFVGVLAGTREQTGKLEFSHRAVLAAGTVALGIVVSQRSLPFAYPLMGTLLAGVIIIMDRVVAKTLAGSRTLAPLRWLGRSSYGVFLLHQPLIRDYNLWWHREILGKIPNEQSLLIGIVLGVTLALLLGLATERIAARIAESVSCSSGFRRFRLTAVLAGLAITATLTPALGAWGYDSTLRAIRAIQRGWTAINLTQGDLESTALASVIIEARFTDPLPPGTHPLFVTGAPGAADLLGIRSTATGTYELVFDHWGFFAVNSVPFASTDRNSIRLELHWTFTGSADTSATRRAGPGDRLVVTVDREVVLDQPVNFHPANPQRVWLGFNGFGGSTMGLRFPGSVTLAP